MLITILGIVALLFIGVVFVLVCLRQEMQPLKIKSPRLLMMSIFANLLMVV